MRKSVDDYALAYKHDINFKEYVDRYSEQHHISADEAFTHAIVREYFDYLLKASCNVTKDVV